MNNKKVFLILNGEPPKKLPNLSEYNIVCATDGGYNFLEKQHITPDFISGDFDSAKKLPDHFEVIHTPDQNFTDFDKILQILFNKGFTTIHVYGASGKEQDHFLGNLHTAIQWKKKLDLTFFDNHGYYFLADNNTVIDNCIEKTVSLVPLPIATKITSKGLQYPLKEENLTFGTRIGTRNKAIKNQIQITFKSGELFIFIND